MNTYALINNGIVENTIVASPDFLSTIENNYEYIIQIDGLTPMPGINWRYIDGTFHGIPSPEDVVVEEFIFEE